VTFSEREDGQIDAQLVGDRPVFNEALSDCISSLPPQGSDHVGPSTYWIDVAIQGARRCAGTNDERPFAWGNCATLRVREGRVLAAYDFDDPTEDDEALLLDAILSLLAAWRDRVVSSTSRTVFPETYRRNPTAG